MQVCHVCVRSGRATFVGSLGDVVTAGQTYYMQLIVQDPGAIAGWAISNALSFMP